MQQERTRKAKKCMRCGFPISEKVRFCPDCGWDQRMAYRKKDLFLGRTLLATLLAVALSLVFWVALTGFREQREVKETQKEWLMRGKDANRNVVHDMSAAAVVGSLMMMNDLIDNVRRKPEDIQSLGKLADISFERKVFGRAVDYYKSYLKLNPGDAAARRKYAAALLSVGDNNQAINEYNAILKQTPADFEANLNLTVALAKAGKKADALVAAEVTRMSANSEGARQQAANLMEAVQSGADPEGAGASPSAGAAAASAAELSGADRVVNLVWDNSQIGSKLVSSQLRTGSGTLLLYFSGVNFDDLDSAARAALLGGLKSKVQSAGVKEINEIRFINNDANNTVMDTVYMSD